MLALKNQEPSKKRLKTVVNTNLKKELRIHKFKIQELCCTRVDGNPIVRKLRIVSSSLTALVRFLFCHFRGPLSRLPRLRVLICRSCPYPPLIAFRLSDSCCCFCLFGSIALFYARFFFVNCSAGSDALWHFLLIFLYFFFFCYPDPFLFKSYFQAACFSVISTASL